MRHAGGYCGVPGRQGGVHTRKVYTHHARREVYTHHGREAHYPPWQGGTLPTMAGRHIYTREAIYTGIPTQGGYIPGYTHPGRLYTPQGGYCTPGRLLYPGLYLREAIIPGLYLREAIYTPGRLYTHRRYTHREVYPEVHPRDTHLRREAPLRIVLLFSP